MRFKHLVVGAAIAPTLIAAAGPQPVRIRPSGPWILEYADNSCRLIRTFGEGEAKTVLLLESEAPGRMNMLATGKPLRSDKEEIGGKFLPIGVKPFEGRRVKTANGGDPAIIWSKVYLLPDQLAEKVEQEMAQRVANPAVRPPPVNLVERDSYRSQRQQFAEKAIELEIQTRRKRPIILETGPMGSPIRMFDKCSRDSLRDWGVDPNLEDKIVREVWAPNPVSWFRTSDYPKQMLRRGEESEVTIRLLVDASGKATKCTSLSHFRAPEFNQITCNVLMKRAKFAPAELADGTKVPSYYTQRVRFEIVR